jgi:hypothetical protein
MTILWVCVTLWIASNLAFAGCRSYVTRVRPDPLSLFVKAANNIFGQGQHRRATE